MRRNYKHFSKKFERVGYEECWPWLGSKDRDGYGRYGADWLEHRAHRVAWEFAFGPVPNNLCVLHKCDNRACVNPAHLWLGTNQDNTYDRSAKGRTYQGPRSDEFRRKASAARKKWWAKNGEVKRTKHREFMKEWWIKKRRFNVLSRI